METYKNARFATVWIHRDGLLVRFYDPFNIER